MKLVTYRGKGDQRVRSGRLLDDVVVELPDLTLVEALGHNPEALPDGGEELPLDSVQLLSPVPDPGKIICVGLNYVEHSDEARMPAPEVPLLFAKYSSAIAGPGEDIRIPADSAEVDFEAELAIIIGREAHCVETADALDVVGGYTNFNDVSARDVQFGEGGQWTRGKSFDTFAPLGPYVATPDEIADPQALRVKCEVNGEVMQDASTKDMIFPLADLITFITRDTTLNPGDIIATGTPPGVGFARTPPVHLEDGDEVVVEVAGLGRLVNRIRAQTRESLVATP